MDLHAMHIKQNKKKTKTDPTFTDIYCKIIPNRAVRVYYRVRVCVCVCVCIIHHLQWQRLSSTSRQTYRKIDEMIAFLRLRPRRHIDTETHWEKKGNTTPHSRQTSSSSCLVLWCCNLPQQQQKKLPPDYHDHHHQHQAGRHSDPIRSHTTSRGMEIEIYCVAFVSFCRFFHPALALLWPCLLWLAGCTWTSPLCFVPMVPGPGGGRDMYVTLNSCIWFSASTIIEAKAQNMMVTATCSMFSMASAWSLALCSLCWWIVSPHPSVCSAALCFCYSRNNCRVLCSTVHRAMFVRRYHRCPSFWVWI